MRQENKHTLIRFRSANLVHGAVNAVGVAHSLYDHGKAMLDAGWGTDRINADPAIRIIVMGLSRICGLTIDHEEYALTYKALGVLRGRLELEGHDVP